MFTPPMSNDAKVFVGGLGAAGLWCSALGALELLGEPGGGSEEALATVVAAASSKVFDRPLGVSGLGEVIVIIFEFGFVIGMADLGTVREAMILARAR